MIDRETAWLRAVAAAGACLICVVTGLETLSPVARHMRRGDPLSGVALGTGVGEQGPRVDWLAAWWFFPRQSRLNVLLIPTDTKFPLRDDRFERIKDAFDRAGPPAVRDWVGRLLSQAGVSGGPAHFIRLDESGWRRILADAGVSVPMAASPVADGDDWRALRDGLYAAHRVARGVLSPMGWWRGLWGPGSPPRADMSMDWWEWPFVLYRVRRWEGITVHPALWPGRRTAGAWEVDPERAAFMLNRMRHGRDEDGVFAGAMSTRVNVWNGAGRRGLAFAVARRLRARGFDVVEVGNTPGPEPETRVVDRSGRFERARAVAAALGAPFVYSDAVPALRVDADVVLGSDFALSSLDTEAP